MDRKEANIKAKPKNVKMKFNCCQLINRGSNKDVVCVTNLFKGVGSKEKVHLLHDNTFCCLLLPTFRTSWIAHIARWCQTRLKIAKQNICSIFKSKNNILQTGYKQQWCWWKNYRYLSNDSEENLKIKYSRATWKSILKLLAFGFVFCRISLVL